MNSLCRIVTFLLTCFRQSRCFVQRFSFKPVIIPILGPNDVNTQIAMARTEFQGKERPGNSLGPIWYSEFCSVQHKYNLRLIPTKWFLFHPENLISKILR